MCFMGLVSMVAKCDAGEVVCPKGGNLGTPRSSCQIVGFISLRNGPSDRTAVRMAVIQ